jgi:antitoxin (DNA-binding transcriptional repressor) of toxin-antitoxin stability system
VPDPQAAFDAAQASALRDAAAQQISGGLSIEQFEDRRRELLEILDGIDRRGDAATSARAAVLRQQVLALRPGGGDQELQHARARLAKTLDRVRLEIALTASGETAAPAAAAPPRDRRAIQALLDRLNQQLTFLAGGSRPGIVDDPNERAAAVQTLTGLLGPCLKCHVMDGARIAPVSAAQTAFQHATFTHKPHVGLADCLTCHAPIATSKQATDLVVPDVANCRQCHATSRARSDCQACHTYHPPSVASLLGVR